MPRPAKVKPAEYTDASEDTEAKPVKAKATDDKWELGQPAPTTRYLNRETGELTDEQPVRAQVIVFAGDTVTEAVLQKLGLA